MAGKCGRGGRARAAIVRMKRAQLLLGRRRRHRRLDRRGQAAEQVVQDRAVEGGLVLEVVVEHRLVHAGPAGDAVDLGAVEAAGRELRGGGGEQSSPGGFDGGGTGSGGGHRYERLRH